MNVIAKGKDVIFDVVQSNEDEVLCRSCRSSFPTLYNYYADQNHKCFSEQERNILITEIIRQKTICNLI